MLRDPIAMSHYLTLRDALRNRPFIAFDLEFTTWEGALDRHWTGVREHREIVQIGAVRIDFGRDAVELEGFSGLVKPVLNPCLSAYFQQLTGISQDEVDHAGMPFGEVFSDFVAFLGDTDEAITSWGGDEMTLHENCGFHRIACPIPLLRFHNIRSTVCEHFGLPYETSSSDLPDILGYPASGRPHQALSDARAIARAIVQMLRSDT